MLEKLKALRAEALSAMKDFNEVHAEMDDTQLAEYGKLQAKFDKANRDVKLSETENILASEVDAVITPTDASAIEKMDYRNSFDNYLAGQNLGEAVAAMTEGVDADGGFTVPVSYQNTVVAKLNDLSATRSISTVIGTDSTRNIPTEGTAPTFAWIDESGVYGETSSTFGNKVLNAYKLGGIIKVSEELLKDTMINFETYMAGQIALGIDKAEAPTFAVGDGVKKPTGYITGATIGASSTTASGTAVTSDEIIDIFYDLKAEYRKSAVWRMTDKTEKVIRKLKNSNGDYIYDAALDSEGRPSLLGRPIVIDNNMAEIGLSAKFICIGDFSAYQIADRGEMTIQRLNELYAGTGMVGFKVTKRVDGKTIIDEAFNVGQNAAV